MCPSVCLCVYTFNIYISASSGLIATTFYPKYHLGSGKTSLCFDTDRSRTLVSMATDSSHMIIFGKFVAAFTHTFDRIFFILAGNEDNQNISDEFEFRPDPTRDCGVSCP